MTDNKPYNEDLLVRHRRQMFALREQMGGPWQPLKEMLRLKPGQFRDDVTKHLPVNVNIWDLEMMLKTWADESNLVDDNRHWLEQAGVKNVATMSYTLGWEDIDYQFDEVLKYLSEAREALLTELLRQADLEDKRPKNLYVADPDMVTVVTERVQIYIRVLFKVEVVNEE